MTPSFSLLASKNARPSSLVAWDTSARSATSSNRRKVVERNMVLLFCLILLLYGGICAGFRFLFVGIFVFGRALLFLLSRHKIAYEGLKLKDLAVDIQTARLGSIRCKVTSIAWFLERQKEKGSSRKKKRSSCSKNGVFYEATALPLPDPISTKPHSDRSSVRAA